MKGNSLQKSWAVWKIHKPNFFMQVKCRLAVPYFTKRESAHGLLHKPWHSPGAGPEQAPSSYGVQPELPAEVTRPRDVWPLQLTPISENICVSCWPLSKRVCGRLFVCFLTCRFTSAVCVTLLFTDWGSPKDLRTRLLSSCSVCTHICVRLVWWDGCARTSYIWALMTTVLNMGGILAILCEAGSCTQRPCGSPLTQDIPWFHGPQGCGVAVMEAPCWGWAAVRASSWRWCWVCGHTGHS